MECRSWKTTAITEKITDKTKAVDGSCQGSWKPQISWYVVFMRWGYAQRNCFFQGSLADPVWPWIMGLWEFLILDGYFYSLYCYRNVFFFFPFYYPRGDKQGMQYLEPHLCPFRLIELGKTWVRRCKMNTFSKIPKISGLKNNCCNWIEPRRVESKTNHQCGHFEFFRGR